MRATSGGDATHLRASDALGLCSGVLRPRRQLERFVGRRVVFEPGDAFEDLIGAVAAQDRVDQPVELDGELLVGERVAIVAGRECDLGDELSPVVERDRHPVGNSGGIAGRELRVFDDAGARDQVEQGRVSQAARG